MGSCACSTPAARLRFRRRSRGACSPTSSSRSRSTRCAAKLGHPLDRGLLEIQGEDHETWYARLTASGVDVVEYTAPAPAGIARPRKYW